MSLDKYCNNAFYIGNGRAMISLGPLTDIKYCPYNCAFCYGKSGFSRYERLEIKEIIEFLISNKDKFNIVYISGDTDSFAPPRTENGIKLIKEISENMNIDILFTTRAILKNEHIEVLKKINENMKKKGNLLIASVSISRLCSAEYIEPYPIPSPGERIALVKKLKQNGLYTILATRPFLPVIPVEEYIEIIKKTKGNVDAVLGEVWYADKTLIENVCRDIKNDDIQFVDKTMDFDNNENVWKCFEAKDTVEKVTKYCEENNIPFFMRSDLAIENIRKTEKR